MANRTLKTPKLITVIVTLGVLFLCGCRAKEVATTNISEASENIPSSSPYSQEATLIAVGDVMMHKAQIDAGYNPATKTYNYDSFFSEVKDILQAGDWVIANLETTLAGADAKYTGYPLFNAPKAIANTLKASGFNIIGTTNNHSLDRGEVGVLNTLQHLREERLTSVGTYASSEEAQEVRVIKENEISMAIFAYTYGTNGIDIPQEKPYLVSLIDESKIIADIKKAESLGVDVITIMLHFGVEYQRNPTLSQQQLVENLIKAGADIILGSHPHVVQPYQIFEVTEANGETRKAVAIYSMGNFIAYQVGSYKDLGVIFQVGLKKDFPSENVEITEIKAIPTYIDNYYPNEKLNFRVLPIEETITAKNDPFLTASDYTKLQGYLTEMNRHLTSMETKKINVQ